jgi:hypothetical protein
MMATPNIGDVALAANFSEAPSRTREQAGEFKEW